MAKPAEYPSIAKRMADDLRYRFTGRTDGPTTPEMVKATCWYIAHANESVHQIIALADELGIDLNTTYKGCSILPTGITTQDDKTL